MQAIGQGQRPPAHRGPPMRMAIGLDSFPYVARHRQAIIDTLGWCGWVLAGGAALFATWELGGFAVLLGP